MATQKKRLYYNPIEIAYPARYISKARGVDCEVTDPSTKTEHPVYIQDMFEALKNGEYDDIVVALSEHEEAYTPEHFVLNGVRRGYKKTPVVGEISLSDYENGGGYMNDNHLYLFWEQEQKTK